MTKQADDDLVKRLKETIEFGLFDAPNPVTFDECLAEIEYLRADLASACAQLREAALDDLAYLGQYTDWQIQAAEREAAAFCAGDEAMRKDAAKTSNQNDQPPQTPSTAPSSSCWCSSGPYCGNAGCYRRTQTTQRW